VETKGWKADEEEGRRDHFNSLTLEVQLVGSSAWVRG
jgi:hypothetical protein